MRDLEYAIRKLDSQANIVNCSDIACVSPDRLYVEAIKRWVKITDFRSAFVRYPYDLIPPHVETYQLREEIERLKTIALLLSHVSLNPVAASWAIRNRLYSLGLAAQYGLLTPASVIVNSQEYIDGNMASDLVLCKAIGYCYVSESTHAIPQAFRYYLRVEEDDGDTAAIFPASSLNEDDIKSYLSSVPVALLQEYIDDALEYRGYYIEGEFFFYMREACSAIDSSAAAYKETPFLPPKEFQLKFTEYARFINLKYICFDLLSKSNGVCLVIDINPYGSLPKYSQFPGPTDSLAKALL